MKIIDKIKGINTEKNGQNELSREVILVKNENGEYEEVCNYVHHS